MGETSLDLRLLRALRGSPTHGYALAQQLADEADRATVYRRLAALRRAGLLASVPQRGTGAQRKAYTLTPAGEERLREELRGAMQLLMEAFGARVRTRGGGGAGRGPRPPVVFVSGARMSGIEMQIVASLARGAPGQVHLVTRAPVRAIAGANACEGSWSSIPFRDGYAHTLFVNELPPARSLAGAVREWSRVLAPRGAINIVAPAPLPRDIDPFVDFLGELRDELYPDSADAAPDAVVTRALRRSFEGIEERREADQRIWTGVKQ